MTRSVLAILAGGPLVACSLINALDEVKPQKQAVVGTDATPTSTTTAANDAAPTDAGVEAGPQKGAIVMGAAVGADAATPPHILTALAPENGAELPKARESLTVAGIRYDGQRDRWYIFQTGGADYFPQPSDEVSLQVRTLDTYTGEWAKLDELGVKPVVSANWISVLSNRLAYIAYSNTTDTNKFDLVVVDTTDKLRVISTVSLTDPTKTLVGITGIPSDTQSGGTLTVFYQYGCQVDGGNATCLDAVHYTVPADAAPTPGSRVLVSNFFGQAGFGTFRTRSLDLIAFKMNRTDSQLQIVTWDGINNAGTGAPVMFGFNDQFVKVMAIDECSGTAFLCGTNADLAVYAVPLTLTSQPSVGHASTQHSGQAVFFDPYTSTVFQPFNQGAGYTLSAFKFAPGNTTTAPTLTKLGAPDWSPPTDLAPAIMATRAPFSFACPK